jgi:hypothetical protein
MDQRRSQDTLECCAQRSKSGSPEGVNSLPNGAAGTQATALKLPQQLIDYGIALGELSGHTVGFIATRRT